MTRDAKPPHDLTDDDVVVEALDSRLSPVVLTGIDFRGLERLEPMPMLEWKGRRRMRMTTLADKSR